MKLRAKRMSNTPRPLTAPRNEGCSTTGIREGKWIKKKFCSQKADQGRYRSKAPISKQTMTSRARKTRFIVMRRSLGSVNQCPKSTNRFLEGSDTISDVAIIDIHRIDLGETFQRCFRL